MHSNATNSRRMSDKLADLVEAEIERIGGADDFSWDWAMSLLPTPEGLAPVGVFSMYLKNPLLGTGDMLHVAMVSDVGSIANAAMVRDLVTEGVKNLRNGRAEVLGQQPPSMPSLIAP